MKDATPQINRDISWLYFNERVLQEAQDRSVPLFERIRFLAIYSSNLDEFFRVRVAQLRNLQRVGKKTRRALDFDPKAVQKQIFQLIGRQLDTFNTIFTANILPELRKHNIYLLRRLELNDQQKQFIESYFEEHMLPFVQPVLLIKGKIKPFLNNGALYISVWMQDKSKINGPDEYGLIKLPSDHLPRFIQLPPSSPDRKDVIMLDDIVRHCISWLFPGYHIRDTFSIKLTRDAELYIEDEFSGDLISKIKSSLTKRNVGPASRFIYDREMPLHLLHFLMEQFDVTKSEIISEGRYHNNADFFHFPDFGLAYLKNQPLPPLPYHELEQDNVFEQINRRDHLINFPYQSYRSVVHFFQQAAQDPDVTHIKIVQYRVAKKSKIMKALMEATEKGKQVSVFVEVKARFDEEANLQWGELLEQAGVDVHYSFPGVKVHSKLALVRRIEQGKPRLYTYLSTGNFNEDTAKIYSDFGFFTADPRITLEVSRIFSFLETVKVPQEQFQHLLVGQFNLREQLVWLIEREIDNARNGKNAALFLKMNSLQDQEMIDLLYKASKAGVSIRLIIRSICCLMPGVRGLSENIEVISIVDRFLEHSRVFVFHNDGDASVYLSSADWMVRNLSYRIETAFPVYDPKLKTEIINLLELQWKDNVKARVIDNKNSNHYRPQQSGDLPIRSQMETYFGYKRNTEA